MIKLPTIKDYTEFVEKFTREISGALPAICFYTFGSMNNGNFNPGRSDIDGGLILDSGVVTPKDAIIKLSELFFRALNDKDIDTNFNLLDRETCRDGRFLSYTEDYTHWLKETARVCCGPNYLREMNGRDFKSGVLYSAAFNFCGPRGVRNALLYSLVHLNRDRDDFMKKISEALGKVAKFPKKLIWLRGGEIIPSRNEARKRLERILEDVDLTILNKINVLLDNPQRLYQELFDKNYAIGMLTESLEIMEQMIDSYLRHFPQISGRELK